MGEPSKDTIYIDIDDEITAIVDKVVDSKSKIVALVLPKRAAVLQSVVNMKLLKRASDEANKQTVLITSEAGLLPLAGATGLYVAKNLQSKPEIPEAPDSPDSDEEEVVESLADDDENDKPVKEMAGAAAIGAAAAAALGQDDAEAEAPDAMAGPESPDKAKKPKKPTKPKPPKGSKIPNFDKFRKKIFIIGGIVALLIIGWILAVFVLPKATVTVTTNTETINSSFQFTADGATSSVDVDKQTVPAEFVSDEKTDSQKVAATGKKDVGTKAKGTVTIRNCSDSSISVKAGTGVSSNNLTFIAQSGVNLGSGNFDSGSNCKSSGSHVGTVQVVAQNNGDQYNLASGSNYNVSGFSSSVSGTGSAMTGGSSKTIKVISQQDIDSAKDKLDTKEDSIKSDLAKKLEEEGFFPITSSFSKQGENISSSAKAGQEAEEVTVTYEAKFYLAGVKKDDLRKLIEDNIKDQIDPEKQQVQDDGIDNANFEVVGGDITTSSLQLSVTTDAEVGPEIDIDQLKTDISGKKSGETENIVRSLPGVQEVSVKYSPFWVNKTPSSVDKITIEFKSAED